MHGREYSTLGWQDPRVQASKRLSAFEGGVGGVFERGWWRVCEPGWVIGWGWWNLVRVLSALGWR